MLETDRFLEYGRIKERWLHPKPVSLQHIRQFCPFRHLDEEHHPFVWDLFLWKVGKVQVGHIKSDIGKDQHRSETMHQTPDRVRIFKFVLA